MDESVTETGEGLSKAKAPYELAMSGNWESLKKFYNDDPTEILSPMTTNNDTALHVVASIFPDLLKDLISLIEDKAHEMSGYALTTEDKAGEMLRYALRIKNYDGNTPLHEAAGSGNLVAAKLLVDKYKKIPSLSEDDDSSNIRLVEIRNDLGESPLYRAAAFGHTNLVEYFLSLVGKDIDSHFQRKDGISILHIAVITQSFETALWLQNKYRHLANRKESNGLTSLQLLAQMPYAFQPEFHNSIWKMLIYKCLFDDDNNDRDPPNQNIDSESGSNQPPNQNNDLESGYNQPRQSSSSKKITKLLGWRLKGKMFEEKQKLKTVLELTDLLVEKEYSWEEKYFSIEAKTFCLLYPNEPKNPPQVKEDADNQKKKDADNCGCKDEGEISKSTYKYTPLLTATCTGICQIVEKILKFHPQAIETRHFETQENILHMAIKYRRLAIFNIVRKKKTMMSRVVYVIDKDGNSILHHAASMKFYTVDTQRVSGPAFQLQEELRWMERVKEIMPPHYPMHKNNQGLTAQMLFENQHAKLLKDAKAWIKGTAQSCSTVAALVATVAYAAAFTAPGGNNGNGVPVLRHSSFFVTFTVADIVSLVCSLTSLCTFLSILTSPFEYENFQFSLPLRLHLGFFLLFFSLVATMLTFTATVVLLIHHQKTWITSLFYVVALLPVSVLGLSQFPSYDGFSRGLNYISQVLNDISQGLNYISQKMRRQIRKSQ